MFKFSSYLLSIVLCLLIIEPASTNHRITLHPQVKTHFREFETLKNESHPTVGLSWDRVTAENYEDLQYYGEIMFGQG